MAPIRVGIDLGQSPIQVGALVLSKYIVVAGSKAIKVNGPEVPNKNEVVEIFKDVNGVTKSYFGAPNFQGAVVVVPNGTSDDNKEAIASAAASYNVMEIINENTAVAAAYAEEVKPSQTRHLAVISVTTGNLDVSIFFEEPGYVFYLVAQETHPVPIEIEEHQANESSQAKESPHDDSSPFEKASRGVFGFVSGALDGAAKTLVVNPLEQVLDVVNNLLSNPKMSKLTVDEVVFVGKASKSEKLKEAVKKGFPAAKVWSPENIEAVELAAFGAGVIAYKQLTKEKREHTGAVKGDAGPERAWQNYYL